jgi:hypothetical protein
MIKKLFLALCLSMMLFSCGGNPQTPANRGPDSSIATNVEAPTHVDSPEEKKIADLKKKLDASDKKAAEATLKSDTIARLTAEKDSLGIRTQLAEAYAEEWKRNAIAYATQEKDKDKELSAAKIDAWREKLWWMAGICGLVALIAGAIAWGMPLIRPVAVRASLILGALAGLCLFVAQILPTIAWLLGFVPYVLVFVGVVVVGYAVVALRHWWKDHNGLSQTIQGIEPIKEEFEDFGDHMLKYVDGSLVDHVKNYRKKLFTSVTKVVTPVVDEVKSDVKKAGEAATQVLPVIKDPAK